MLIAHAGMKYHPTDQRPGRFRLVAEPQAGVIVHRLT
jgi:hypothetical protein